MKKIFIIILLIIILVVIWRLSTKQETIQEEEKEESVIIGLLENLEQGTGINFSEIEEVEFKWFEKAGKEIEELTITGKGFGVTKISDEQYMDVESFFENNDFKIDKYNISAGTVVGAVGYKKDNLACLLIAGITGYKEAEDQPASPAGGWIPEEWDTNDVDVKCGEIIN